MPNEPPGFRPPTHPRTRRLGAREALVCIAVATLLLLLFEGPSIRRSGERMDPGILRGMVLAIGHPAGWLGDKLPLAEVGDELTAWVSADEDLDAAEGAGFASGGTESTEVPRVGAEAFDPRELGGEAPAPRGLRKLLITGDSMAMPLDAVLARRLADGDAVQVTRDPHLGSGISKTGIVDWAKLSGRQTVQERPDAVVFFLGANEGFPMEVAGESLECCDPRWAAEYAFRARQMMNIYRREGEARVYWLTLPLPRDDDRAEIARAVNAAIRVAAQPYRAHVRVVEMQELFTPGGEYRESMAVDGEERLVRDADGIHLNEAGAELAADRVQEALAADFSIDLAG
jgi:lysophospholipase L1-like esterase